MEFRLPDKSLDGIRIFRFNPDGIQIEESSYRTYVKSDKAIPNNIVVLMGITNKKIANAPTFDDAFSSIIWFVHEKLADSSSSITNLCFVAHNGKGFDLPLLLKQIKKYNISRWNGFCTRWDPLYIDILQANH